MSLELLVRLVLDDGRTGPLDLSADGRWLASEEAHGVDLYDLDSDAAPRRCALPGKKDTIVALAVEAGRLAVARGRSLFVVDADGASRVAHKHRQPIDRVLFAGGRLASVARFDPEVFVDAGGAARTVTAFGSPPKGRELAIVQLALDPVHDALVAVVRDRSAREADGSTRYTLRRLPLDGPSHDVDLTASWPGDHAQLSVDAHGEPSWHDGHTRHRLAASGAVSGPEPLFEVPAGAGPTFDLRGHAVEAPDLGAAAWTFAASAVGGDALVLSRRAWIGAEEWTELEVITPRGHVRLATHGAAQALAVAGGAPLRLVVRHPARRGASKTSLRVIELRGPASCDAPSKAESARV